MNIERCGFLNQINDYIRENGELEKFFKLLDYINKRNDELEEKIKKVKEENYLLKDELEEKMKQAKEEEDLLKDELNYLSLKQMHV